MKKREKKTPKVKPLKPHVNPELEGFDFSINSFGEINSTKEIDVINKFLTKNLPDKKLQNIPRKKK